VRRLRGSCHPLTLSISQWLTKYDDQKEIAKDNCAAAIKIFGTIVSIGIGTGFLCGLWKLHNSDSVFPTVIAHPLFVTESVYAFGLYYVCATVILVVLRYWLSYIIIPGKRTVDVEISEDANWFVVLGRLRGACLVMLMRCVCAGVLPRSKRRPSLQPHLPLAL